MFIENRMRNMQNKFCPIFVIKVTEIGTDCGPKFDFTAEIRYDFDTDQEKIRSEAKKFGSDFESVQSNETPKKSL